MTVSFDPDREVFVREGEAWFPDAPSLCRRLKIEYIYISSNDGELWAGVQGKGEFHLASLLFEEKESNLSIVPIK